MKMHLRCSRIIDGKQCINFVGVSDDYNPETDNPPICNRCAGIQQPSNAPPTTTPKTNGTLVEETEQQRLEVMKRYCAKYNVIPEFEAMCLRYMPDSFKSLLDMDFTELCIKAEGIRQEYKLIEKALDAKRVSRLRSIEDIATESDPTLVVESKQRFRKVPKRLEEKEPKRHVEKKVRAKSDLISQMTSAGKMTIAEAEALLKSMGLK